MTMEKQQAIEKLTQQLQIIDELIKPYPKHKFSEWKEDTEVCIKNIFGLDSENLNKFKSINYSLYVSGVSRTHTTPPSVYQEAYKKGLQTAKSIIKSMIKEITDYWPESKAESKIEQNTISDLEIIEQLCNRFHLVTKQLKIRYKNRATLEITDEYDVQDLFHSLLKLHFDIIIDEEPIPNCAASSSRVDFFLPEEKIFIEIKKPRKNLGDKEIRNELIIDIEQYKKHHGWTTLVCFVYDPDERIKNPRLIEKDLSKTTDGLDVKVFIRPKNE